MSDESIAVIAIAEIFGISGRRSELAALLTVTEQHAQEFPGSRRYVFAADLETPDQFVLVSASLVARASEMTVYSVTDAVRPVPSGPPDRRDAD